MAPQTTLEDIIGIEHSKLGFFQEVQRKVAELRHSNEELEHKQREIQAILDGISDIMLVLSADMRILSVNQVFFDHFEEPNPVGKYCFEVFRGQAKACRGCPARESMRSGEVCKETAIFKVNGRNRQYDMLASPLQDTPGQEGRVLLFKRDVTLEKEYQAQFYQAEKMATIGMLAAGVAHEVNNPLAGIQGFAQGILRRLPRVQEAVDEELANDFQEYTETILQECNRCQEIVRTLLTFSRPRESAFCSLSMNNLIRDTLKVLQHRIKRHQGLLLQEDLEPELPLVCGDEPHLKQVILNLLTNALDAIGEEGVITIRTSSTENQVALCVEDTGEGIPEEHLDKLFEPFFTTKPVGRGTGIGLSTCYTIVHNHGGEISVKSAPEKGSRFCVVLPKRQGNACEQPITCTYR